MTWCCTKAYVGFVVLEVTLVEKSNWLLPTVYVNLLPMPVLVMAAQLKVPVAVPSKDPELKHWRKGSQPCNPTDAGRLGLSWGSGA